MKRNIIKLALVSLVMVLCFLIGFPVAGAEFRLPVRVTEDGRPSLAAENTQVKVNGEPLELRHILERSRTVGSPTDLGKNYILSFHAAQFSRQIEEGISYFVTEILQPHDALILMTPIKVYSIAVSANKAKIIMDIVELLSEDYEVYEKDRKNLENSLETELNMIRRNVSSYMQTHDDEVSIYKRVAQFLYNYAELFAGYRDRYLLPSLQTNLSLKELLGEREGERWWIHFHHRDNLRVIKKIDEVTGLLHEYIDELGAFEPTLGRTMKFHLSNFEQDIDMTGAFDFQKILDELALENISYLTVFWGHLESASSRSSDSIISDLRDAFIEISRSTGGRTVSSTRPEDGLMSLKGHTDQYYELVFDLPDDPESIEIRVEMDGSEQGLFYKKNLNREKIAAWMEKASAEKIRVSDLSLKRKRIATFTLSGFETDKINRFGMLKVRLSLLGDNSGLVYTASNILRASEKEVEVSVPIPKEHQGTFTVMVKAIDMLANKMDSITEPITLK